MARGLRELLHRRAAPDRPVEALLADRGTVRAAAAAFDLADRPEEPWWPCAAAVGADSVSVRMAGLTVPAAEAPWRPGHDPRVWVVDRATLAEAEPEGSGHAPLLIGGFDDTIVFVDTRRAPGPITVTGDSESVAGVKDLIDRQVLDQDPDVGPETDAGADWPLDVDGSVIRFVGLAVATVLSDSDAQRAIELVRRAAADDDLVDDREPEPSKESGMRSQSATNPIPETADSTSGAAEADRSVGVSAAATATAVATTTAAAADQAGALDGFRPHQAVEAPFRLDREPPLAAESAHSGEPEVAASSPYLTAAPTIEPTSRPRPDTTAPASIEPFDDEPDPSDFAASSQPASPTPPADAAPDPLDDWESGFAVSSADE